MNTENLKCNRCEHELVVEEVCDYDKEAGVVTYLRCPYCGAAFECVEQPEEEKKNFDFYKDGEPIEGRFEGVDLLNEHCINCGHKIYVGNNFMLSDYDDSIESIEDDKMNFVMNECPYCGMNEVRWDNSENEKKDYDYWAEDNWLHDHLKGYDLSYLIHIWAVENDKDDEELKEELKKLPWKY